MRWLDRYRYLTRLAVPTTEAERSRVETLLGVARLVLVAAVALDRPETFKYSGLVNFLLSVWVVQSLLMLCCVSRGQLSRLKLLLLHLSDILWPTLLLAFSHHANESSAGFLLALIAAGFRWGFVEAMLTSVACALALEVHGLWQAVAAAGAGPQSRLLIRCATMLAIGYLIGILGENEKERGAEAAVITRALHAARAENSMRAVLYGVLRELISLFSPAHVYVVSQEVASGRVYLWRMTGTPKDPGPYVKELYGEERFDGLLSAFPETFFCSRISPGRFRMVSLGARARGSELDRLPAAPFLPPDARSLLGVSAWLGQEWKVRVLLSDASVGRAPGRELDFARQLLERLAPALYGTYLVRRLRSRASALERARVARELHDGAIQSLISTEMRCDILRRRAQKESPGIAAEIESLQELVRNQVFELRELMCHLKPAEVDPGQLQEHMAEQVERFRRESGIAAHFSSDDSKVELAPRACRELLLVLQEALVNIRKHAHAAKVTVRFERSNLAWLLSVSDDGKGLAFEGKLEGDELMKSARGPAIIKERVACLGGELVIESRPTRGTHLLVKIPLESELWNAVSRLQ